MKKIKQLYLTTLLIIVSLSILSCRGIALAANEGLNQLPAPAILSAVQIKDGDSGQILISGLAPTGYNVEIYINGKYEGVANISQITDNFTKFSFLSRPLTSNQNFEVMAINQNVVSLKFSAPTIASVRSIIEKKSFAAEVENLTTKPLVASSTIANIYPPTISVTGQNVCIPNPNISGSAKNQNQTLVYVDDKLSVIIPAHEQSTGTSSFSYSPSMLERGQHSVYVIARDNNGNKSAKPNTLSFCVSSPQIINATSTTAERIEQKPTSSLVFQKTTDKKPANDSGNKQRGTLNLIIFVVFIACLGIWITLVNRELIDDKDKTGLNK